jgi:protein-disulfide isomerase
VKYKIYKSASLFLAVFMLALTLSSCTQGKQASKADEIVRPLADDFVIIEYKGGSVTAKDIAKEVNPGIKELQGQVIEQYKQAANRALLMKLLEAEAKKEGVATPQELLMRKVQPRDPSEEEITAFMKQNGLEKPMKDPKTGKMEKVSRDDIKQFLGRQSMQEQQQAYFASLRTAVNPKVKIEEPRVKIAETGKEPFHGNQNAKVVIHEFSDFECPFCARGKTLVTQIKEAYGDKVKVVFRNFPLEFHPNAEPAARAALCAHKQGKFWEFHDKAFDNQKGLTEANFVAWAGELGLKADDFKKCLGDDSVKASLESDLKAAESLGVNSTPTFYVNGRKVAGALPFDQMKQMIDQELAGR